VYHNGPLANGRYTVETQPLATDQINSLNWTTPSYIYRGDTVAVFTFRQWESCRTTGTCKTWLSPNVDLPSGDIANVAKLTYDLSVQVPPPVVTVSISGPGSVTTQGGHTWTATASGGKAPYTIRWYRKLQSSPATAYVEVGTGSTYSQTVYGGAPAFSLKATARSSDAGTGQDEHSVTVSIPLVVSLSGPQFITQKGTYAFVAGGSGHGLNPIYEWYERFCTSASEASCVSSGDWTLNMPSTFTRTLGPDCVSGQQRNWRLRVVVRRSDGAVASQEHVTWLCGAPIE
jgi:hypothetical protein